MSLVAEMIVNLDANIQGVLTSVRKKLEEKYQDPRCLYVQQAETIDRLKDDVNLYRESQQIQELRKFSFLVGLLCNVFTVILAQCVYVYL